MADSESAEFRRGHDAGGIAERLASHDKHFEAINGSLADVAKEMHELTLAVQRLGDQAVSRDATVITTAAALREAEAARRDKSEQSWSPFTRFLAGLAVVLTLAGLAWAVWSGARG